jgi:hypothetical protein
MVGVSFQALAGIGGAVLPSVSYRGQSSDLTAQSTYTFSNVDIGVAAANRLVVVGVGRGTSGRPLLSATIGGIAATINIDSSSQGGAAIISAVVPTGTTATIVINLAGGTSNRCVIGRYALYDLNSSSPAATPVAVSGTTGSQSITIVSCLANGISIVNGYYNNSGAMTPTNYIEDYDVLATTRFMGGHDIVLADGNRTYTTNPVTTLVGCHWR